MNFKLPVFALAISLAFACSRPSNSNKEFSDTAAVYNKNTGATTADSLTDTSTSTDSGSRISDDNNNQAPRVNVGKDTVGKSSQR